MLVNRYFAEPQTSLINGMLLGVKINASGHLYSQIKEAGLLHLVVLSGSNIAILGSIVLFLTSWTGKRLSLLITILTIIIFNLFISFQAPLVRSSLMVIFTSVASITGRQSHPLYALFLTGFFMLILWPNLITDLSFQLSFASTLGIVLFSEIQINNKSYILSFIFSELKTGLAAYAFTAPILAFYFKQISLIGIVSNLLLSPFVPLIMIFGIILVLLGKINFYLGILPSYLLYGMVSWVLLVIDVASRVPYGYLDFSQ